MALLSLPISNIRSNYEFTSTLDDVEYNLNFRYNPRSKVWYLSIADETNTVIVANIPIYINQDLLAQYRAYPIPQGLMMCVNNSDGITEPTRDNFSVETVILYYEV